MTAAARRPSRRSFLVGGASLAAMTLSGCATERMRVLEPRFSDYYLSMYGPLPDEQFPVPAIDLTKLDPNMFRTEVADPTGERPGTIVVNTSERHLYLVQEGGQAIRYGVGIGREGFAWSGRAYVGRKAEWPTWTPPKEMMQRQPEARKYAGGMPGGLDNPLGARTLYLYQNGAYTLYTIYSTSVAQSIGTGITSGCTGLLTQDMMDLYDRTPVKTKVIVLPA